MDDVAREAGVSLGTVSHVINHPHRVAAPTLERVRRVIDDLGFVPDRRARALARGTSTTIGFVVIDLTNSYFVDMARGAEEAAAEAGMNVLLANSDMNREKEQTYLDLFGEERVAGILVSPTARWADTVWRSQAARSELVVLNTPAGPDRCSVVPDDELGGYLAARHLIDSGRRHLAFAAGLFHLAPVAQRLRGAERAVAEAGGRVRLTILTTQGLRSHHGQDVGRQLLAMDPAQRPDGVFAAADLVALGIVQALSGSELRVPDDVGVVGYDNNQASWASPVPLTTVAQPGHEMGRTATRLLLEEIERPGRHTHQQLLVEPELIVRGSSVPGQSPSNPRT